MKKIRIERVSIGSIAVTILLGILLAFVSSECTQQFAALQTATDEYIECENQASELQAASDYLAEQVRLFVVTGQREYMDLYFEEKDVTRRQEKAFTYLEQEFDGTTSLESLKTALNSTKNLSYADRYAMRLAAEAYIADEESWPEAIRAVTLHESDQRMTDSEKIRKAQQLVCNDQYQTLRENINDNVAACTQSLIEQTKNRQNNAATVFSDIYLRFEISVVALILMVLMMCAIVQHLIVKPLLLKAQTWIPDGKAILMTVFLSGITPVCSALNSMVQLYDRDMEESGALYVLTTLLSIVTMPMVIAVFERVM